MTLNTSKPSFIFAGQYTYRLDSRNRISVPSEWRNTTQDRFLFIGKGEQFDVPVLMTFRDEELQRILKQNPSTESNINKAGKHPIQIEFEENLIKIHAMPLDGQGRIRIPQSLLAHAGLIPGSDAVLIGYGDNFQILGSSSQAELEVKMNAMMEKIDQQFADF